MLTCKNDLSYFAIERFDGQISCKTETIKLDVYHFALAGKSTTHALAYFLHALLQSLDHGDVFACVFFADFTAKVSTWSTTAY